MLGTQQMNDAEYELSLLNNIVAKLENRAGDTSSRQESEEQLKAKSQISNPLPPDSGTFQNLSFFIFFEIPLNILLNNHCLFLLPQHPQLRFLSILFSLLVCS